MEPLNTRKPDRSRNNNLLFGTAAVLVAGFIIILLLFFAFSWAAPSFLGKCVAVVNIDGELTTASASPSLFSAGAPGSEDIASAIDALNKRDDIGSVLFVFNSPGGSVVATREIYSSIKSLNKPKVAYFREVAASGAYYSATGTDYIISDPDAITGSIGVIATFSDLSGLMEKVGVNVTAIKSGPHKDIGSEFRNLTPEEREILQSLIDDVYGEFRSVVVANRGKHLNMQLFEKMSDGRIMDGRQALAVGLIDQVGSKKDAILKAAQLANSSARSSDEVTLCPVSFGEQQSGLFNLAAMLRQLNAKSGFSLNFR
ncbi:signal peptide peptidase SppA [Candidatus Micrarchaeota archaeon]|nr:signal peptide peptidase SppA [Candidatus Micrarchaeota archaeon]